MTVACEPRQHLGKIDGGHRGAVGDNRDPIVARLSEQQR
jgi:hypothetical protein